MRRLGAESEGPAGRGLACRGPGCRGCGPSLVGQGLHCVQLWQVPSHESSTESPGPPEQASDESLARVAAQGAAPAGGRPITVGLAESEIAKLI
jgi:hypothetical protein